jgi:integrase
MGRVQQGYVYAASGAFYVRYWDDDSLTGETRTVQRSERLCAGPDGEYQSEKNGGTPCTLDAKGDRYSIRKVRGKRVLSSDLKRVLNSFMDGVNRRRANGTKSNIKQDMRIVDFWDQHYLPYCEKIVEVGERTGRPRKKPSTMKGYRQLWRQHLNGHFGELTLREYEPDMGTTFLDSLTNTQSSTTIRHIKALGSAIFKRALIEKRIKVNPWHDVEMPDDAIAPERTQHYTIEEAEDIISALVDHLDCQLILALSCFLGIRPGEIAALRWEDFDSDNVHIRRRVFEGDVDVPKTPESVAPLPLIDQVRIPLKLWRKQCGKPSDGWVFESRNGTPVDLHNVISRIIIPHVNGKKKCVPCDRVPKKSGVTWKGLYAGRRGACTAVIEATKGDYSVAQALLRHKSMQTTLNVYKKQITPAAFKEGMMLYQRKALAAKSGDSK